MTTSDSPGNQNHGGFRVQRGYPGSAVTRFGPMTTTTRVPRLAPVIPVPREDRDQSRDQARDQPSSYAPRPDPELLLIALTRGVMEAMAGAREPEQLARWLSEAAFASVLKRVVLANRARAVTKRKAVVPTTAIVRVIITEPIEGVIEAVVIVRSRVRARSVAIRLEGLGDRWIATSFRVL